MATILDGDVMVRGALRVGSLALPADAVGDTQFTAADPLTAAKQQHQYVQRFAQAHGSAATAERRVVHVAHAAGTLVAFAAGPVVAPVGDSTVTIDLKKNGSTVLSATVVLDNTNAAFSSEAAAFSSSTYAAGDVFEVVQTVSAGTGTLPQGVWAALTVREAAD